MGRFDGKVVLISGGEVGIGKAAAIGFAKEGAKVVIGGIDEKEGMKTALEIGGPAYFRKMDVTQKGEVKSFVEEAIAKWRRIDVLFANAGVFSRCRLEEVEEEEWDRVIDTNLKGVFLCIKYAIPHMKKQGSGAIISTASECGWTGFPEMGPYSASKAGVLLLSKSLCGELSRFNIRINTVSPARVLTPMHINRFAAMPPAEGAAAKKELDDSVPLGRMGLPEEIANVVLFLASEEASFVTGADYLVDGGCMSTTTWDRYRRRILSAKG